MSMFNEPIFSVEEEIDFDQRLEEELRQAELDELRISERIQDRMIFAHDSVEENPFDDDDLLAEMEEGEDQSDCEGEDWDNVEEDELSELEREFEEDDNTP